MYDKENLPGNPYAPDYLGDTDGAAAQAAMAAAYETRTAGMIALIPYITDRSEQIQLITGIRRRYGLERR